MDAPNTEAAALLWEQARQQLAQQNSDLDLLRTRATAILSVAALVAGLFGTRIPAHPGIRSVSFVIVALSLFAVSALLAVAVAAPRRNWEFTFNLDPLLQRVDDHEAAPVDVTRNLAAWSEIARRKNSQKLEQLYMLFRLVCVLVGLQVISWAIAVL